MVDTSKVATGKVFLQKTIKVINYSNKAKRIISCKGIEAYFDRKMQNCPGCALLNYNRNRAQIMKETPLPDMLGELILVDQIHRK